MSKPKPSSLKSSLRKSITQVYRARNGAVNNLWLVYSIKTNKDLILPSDRQLIHWLYYLETNHEVTSFDLAPEPILSKDDNETRATELDAIVTKRDGTIEWHEVKAGKKTNDPAHESQMRAQINAASLTRVSYHRFNDLDFEPHIKEAVRWIKAINFASAIRDQDHFACRTTLVMTIKELKSGKIQIILDNLNGYDISVVLGILVRLAIEGIVNLNLKDKTFGLQTRWEYRG
jgi:hypothetical protein